MMGNRARKVMRAEHSDPINFTCGICRRVHEYKGDYNCTMEDEENKEEEEDKKEE